MTSWEPENSYWLREKDGLLYSSAEDRFVSEKDAAYQTWRAQGNEPNSFPRDAEGEESFLLLMNNLAGYGIGEINKLKMALTALDEKYKINSIRFACDLANGDEWAKGQWTEHEVEAEPLRKRLADIIKNTD